MMVRYYVIAVLAVASAAIVAWMFAPAPLALASTLMLVAVAGWSVAE